MAQVGFEHGPAYEGKKQFPSGPSGHPPGYELFDRYCELSPKSASAEMLTNIMSQRGPWHIS